jgi:hypothetical protein
MRGGGGGVLPQSKLEVRRRPEQSAQPEVNLHLLPGIVHGAAGALPEEEADGAAPAARREVEAREQALPGEAADKLVLAADPAALHAHRQALPGGAGGEAAEGGDVAGRAAPGGRGGAGGGGAADGAVGRDSAGAGGRGAQQRGVLREPAAVEREAVQGHRGERPEAGRGRARRGFLQAEDQPAQRQHDEEEGRTRAHLREGAVVQAIGGRPQLHLQAQSLKNPQKNILIHSHLGRPTIFPINSLVLISYQIKNNK